MVLSRWVFSFPGGVPRLIWRLGYGRQGGPAAALVHSAAEGLLTGHDLRRLVTPEPIASDPTAYELISGWVRNNSLLSLAFGSVRIAHLPGSNL